MPIYLQIKGAFRFRFLIFKCFMNLYFKNVFKWNITKPDKRRK